MFGYEPKGRGFESLTPCQEKHRGYFLGAFLLYDDTMKNPAILLFAKLQRLRCGERAVIDFSTANAGSESLTPCRAAEHLSPTPAHTPCHFVTSPSHPRGGVILIAFRRGSLGISRPRGEVFHASLPNFLLALGKLGANALLSPITSSSSSFLSYSTCLCAFTITHFFFKVDVNINEVNQD